MRRKYIKLHNFEIKEYKFIVIITILNKNKNNNYNHNYYNK